MYRLWAISLKPRSHSFDLAPRQRPPRVPCFLALQRTDGDANQATHHLAQIALRAGTIHLDIPRGAVTKTPLWVVGGWRELRGAGTPSQFL